MKRVYFYGYKETIFFNAIKRGLTKFSQTDNELVSRLLWSCTVFLYKKNLIFSRNCLCKIKFVLNLHSR